MIVINDISKITINKEHNNDNNRQCLRQVLGVQCLREELKPGRLELLGRV